MYHKTLFLAISLMTSLSLFAVDAHGSHADLGDSSTPTWLLVVLAIIVTVFGIPFAVASLNSRDKDDKKFGCFCIVGIIVAIIFVLKGCSG